ncbi:MAG: NAD-dependent epimerase/dehydratase family protein [Cytophagales bacterium]|nr:NAD-dependent epimerase/dehydratase family protein [Cytophagales bacterium]
MEKILVIGAFGQLGTELTISLREKFGTDQVIASDLNEGRGDVMDGPFEQLNIMDDAAYQTVLKKHDITQVYHLAAILSAKGENDPLFAWRLNMDSLLRVLESGKDQVKKIYWPSSIAVFGPDTPSKLTPQTTIMNPTTVYGISKLAGERWCEYYHQKYAVDVRSVRYPGLIGYKSKPGGGTTDYAVDIYWKAVEGSNFECYLKPDMMLPMMYMDDAVRGTIEIMEAVSDSIKVRSSYNLTGVNFRPDELYKSIIPYYPDFKISYAPDFRQEIAKSWPRSIDDGRARTDWGWHPKYDLTKMTETMIAGLKSMLIEQ